MFFFSRISSVPFLLHGSGISMTARHEPTGCSSMRRHYVPMQYTIVPSSLGATISLTSQ